MTQMQVTGCESHSVVNDTNAFGQWHECRETGFFAPPYRTVNDTNAFGQWHECRSLSVNHTQSITQMQIAKCNIHSALIPECDLDLVKFSWVWFTLSAFVSLTVSLTGFKLCIPSYQVDWSPHNVQPSFQANLYLLMIRHLGDRRGAQTTSPTNWLSRHFLFQHWAIAATL